VHDDQHFAKHIGVEIIEITPDKGRAKLTARPGLANRRGILHGGAIMSLADTMGGIGTTANLPKGASTTTIESKTNFFSPVPLGDTAHAECLPLHRGRTKTRITRGDGKLAAMVTQKQLVLAPPAAKA
jgi:uncharacterized protein (TIGR00369 family)